jgi:NAD+ kinase
MLVNGEYEIEERTLLSIESDEGIIGRNNLALNEVALHKNDHTSMIVVHAYVDGEFLNSYWADGLIVATPTGSTAYSLSVGGPIVDPASKNFIIAPIAPHNLNVRPMVISDDSEVVLCVEGRSEKSILSIDSKSFKIDSSRKIIIKKANHKIRLIKFPNQTFFKTLRHKLNWGLDKRN